MEPLTRALPLVMEIQKTSAITATNPGPKNLSRALSQLQPGTALNAVVIDKLGENSFILKLSNGLLLQAQTSLLLALGQVLKLEVIKSGELPELKIVVPQPAFPEEKTVIMQALRQYLPKQQNLADFAMAIRQFTSLSSGKSDTVNTAIHDVLDALMTKDELISAEGLKTGISNSGVFLEAKLANLLSPQGDLKAHLLTLADTLQKTQITDADKSIGTSLDESIDQDKALFNKTEGAIARIVLDQLASLPKNDDPQINWQIEIPYTDGDHTNSVKLKINRDEKPSDENNQPNWSVVLELNPPSMGTLHSKISLMDGMIDTYFWSDQQSITSLVQEQIEILTIRYKEAGLSVGKLNVLEGAAINTKSSEPAILPSLFDEYT